MSHLTISENQETKLEYILLNSRKPTNIIFILLKAHKCYGLLGNQKQCQLFVILISHKKLEITSAIVFENSIIKYKALNKN